MLAVGGTRLTLKGGRICPAIGRELQRFEEQDSVQDTYPRLDPTEPAKRTVSVRALTKVHVSKLGCRTFRGVLQVTYFVIICPEQQES